MSSIVLFVFFNGKICMSIKKIFFKYFIKYEKIYNGNICMCITGVYNHLASVWLRAPLCLSLFYLRLFNKRNTCLYFFHVLLIEKIVFISQGRAPIRRESAGGRVGLWAPLCLPVRPLGRLLSLEGDRYGQELHQWQDFPWKEVNCHCLETLKVFHF